MYVYAAEDVDVQKKPFSLFYILKTFESQSPITACEVIVSKTLKTERNRASAVVEKLQEEQLKILYSLKSRKHHGA